MGWYNDGDWNHLVASTSLPYILSELCCAISERETIVGLGDEPGAPLSTFTCADGVGRTQPQPEHFRGYAIDALRPLLEEMETALFGLFPWANNRRVAVGDQEWDSFYSVCWVHPATGEYLFAAPRASTYWPNYDHATRLGIYEAFRYALDLMTMLEWRIVGGYPAIITENQPNYTQDEFSEFETVMHPRHWETVYSNDDRPYTLSEGEVGVLNHWYDHNYPYVGYAYRTLHDDVNMRFTTAQVRGTPMNARLNYLHILEGPDRMNLSATVIAKIDGEDVGPIVLLPELYSWWMRRSMTHPLGTDWITFAPQALHLEWDAASAAWPVFTGSGNRGYAFCGLNDAFNINPSISPTLRVNDYPICIQTDISGLLTYG